MGLLSNPVSRETYDNQLKQSANQGAISWMEEEDELRLPPIREEQGESNGQSSLHVAEGEHVSLSSFGEANLGNGVSLSGETGSGTEAGASSGFGTGTTGLGSGGFGTGSGSSGGFGSGAGTSDSAGVSGGAGSGVGGTGASSGAGSGVGGTGASGGAGM